MWFSSRTHPRPRAQRGASRAGMVSSSLRRQSRAGCSRSPPPAAWLARLPAAMTRRPHNGFRGFSPMAAIFFSWLEVSAAAPISGSVLSIALPAQAEPRSSRCRRKLRRLFAGISFVRARHHPGGQAVRHKGPRVYRLSGTGVAAHVRVGQHPVNLAGILRFHQRSSGLPGRRIELPACRLASASTGPAGGSMRWASRTTFPNRRSGFRPDRKTVAVKARDRFGQLRHMAIRRDPRPAHADLPHRPGVRRGCSLVAGRAHCIVFRSDHYRAGPGDLYRKASDGSRIEEQRSMPTS